MPYNKDLRPLPSLFRPHCLAQERLLLWLPLCSPRKESQLPLSQEDLQRVFTVISHAYAPSTLESYGSGLLVFHVFCDLKGVSESQRAPASTLLISAFVAALAGSYSGDAIANYTAAIHAWHVLHGVEWEMNQDQLKALYKGSSRLTPPASKWQKRAPYTVTFLLSIWSTLDLTNPLHAAFWACLTTTFYCTSRLGEFVVPSLQGFSCSQHVTRSDVTVAHDRNQLKTTSFHLPSTKCSPINGEDVSWAKQDGLTDPESALDNHLAVNNPLSSEEALFSYTHTDGKRRPLTRRNFLKCLAEAGRKAGVEVPPAHGIRIGSVLEYLLRGMPFIVMQVKGRWAGPSFIKYLRQHAEILAPYMQANSVVLADFTRIAMPPVQ
ncbi:hypothetical protein BT96DRAFT_997856 [Gymnopus androsaceus JB14]|uniref:Tyr recombinase domain-containing protein n=1 Tax=Gymnopus androsaceus JB14 TaxID=1447944 RepID=A0A6A4HDN1_9AGAR|nr:hypothetical protein BT96DRAFT_997856 [Gymnopus androsaceus JB14]